MPIQPKIHLTSEDITTLKVDAIVNAANSALAGGGGVDGAIHRAAGPELLRACLEIGRCPTGEAVITKGYNLPANYVIHAVGPVWWNGDKNEHKLLASCYQRSLEIASENNIDSIAFPAISCGAYKFPIDQACIIAVDSVISFCKKHPVSPSNIYFVCFDPKVKQAYTNYLDC